MAIGFGALLTPSRIRIPRPPQNRTTFTNHTSLDNVERGNRVNELPAPGPYVLQLLADLVPQVPRQDEDVVRPRLGQAFRRVDGNVRAGQELPLLDRAPVDRVREQVGPDAAVVEQGVPLAGGAVAGHRPAAGGGVEQEPEQVGLDLQHPGPETLVPPTG